MSDVQLDLDVHAPAPDAPVPRTVEDAVLALSASRTFHNSDCGLGHGSAARIRAGVALDAPTRATLHRLIAGYHKQLDALGIPFLAVIVPEGGHQAPPPRPTHVGRSSVKVRVKKTGEPELLLRSPWEARSVVAQDIPSATWDKALSVYVLPATPAAALSVFDALGEYGVTGDQASGELLREGYRLRGAARFRVSEDLPPIAGSKTSPWLHQLQAYHFVRALAGGQLDMDMGTGKSKVVVDVLTSSGAETTMIICPERVVGVWPKQFSIHAGREHHVIDPRKQNRKGEWSLLPIPKRIELYDHALHECECGLPHVLLGAYAASASEAFKRWSERQRFDYLIFDESHRLRSADGVWSKWAAKMQKRAERRLGGTGTLQAQTPLDVFGQFRALDPGVFGDNFTLFKRRYGILGGFEGKQVMALNPHMEQDLAERIASITYRAGPEVLDLPPELPELTETDHLSPKCRRIYDEVESQLFAEVRRVLADGVIVLDEITAKNVLVKLLRLQQITGGTLQLDSGAVENIDHTKEDLLADLLEDIPEHEPVVVFCRFHPDLEAIARVAKRLGRPYGELSGRSSTALAADATLSPDVAVAGVQIQAGNAGVDFTRSAFAVYYSVGHSLSDYLQSRKRLIRPGQTRSVRLRHLVMSGTVDEDVYQALADRQSVVDRVADRVRALQAAGLR